MLYYAIHLNLPSPGFGLAAISYMNIFAVLPKCQKILSEVSWMMVTKSFYRDLKMGTVLELLRLLAM
jgi:hypothetical protein